MQLSFVYSVYKRYNILKQNLELFKKLNIQNIYFLIDPSPVFDNNNLKCISLVKKFCKENGAKFYKPNVNFGYYCMLINFFKSIKLEVLSSYFVIVEDDFLLTESFFKFHNYASLNLSDYGAVIPFGLNVSSKFNLFEIEPYKIKGCLWGAGYNLKGIKNFVDNDLYMTFKEDYMDLSYLKYLNYINKKIILSSHNLFSYKGFEDSRDKNRLISCTKFPEIFDANLDFEFNFKIDNTLTKKYLEKHDFYVNDCKECI